MGKLSENKYLFINVVLIVIIALLSYALITTPEKYERPDSLVAYRDEINAAMASETETVYTDGGVEIKEFQHLGKTNIFRAIIKKKIPPPPPPPPPPRPPDIDTVIKPWKILLMLDGEVTMQDTKIKKIFDPMKVGHVEIVKYRGKAVEIELIELDEDLFRATFGFGEQRTTKKMF